MKEFNTSNIAFFVPSLDGGVGKVTAALALGMHEKNIHVEVWSASGPGGYSKELGQTLTMCHLGTGSVRSSFIPLIKMLRKQKPKIVFGASFHANCILILASRFIKQRPQIIIAEHTSLEVALKELSFFKRILMTALIRLLYPIANAHIAVSEGVAKGIAKYGGVNISGVSVISNPVVSDELFEKSKQAVSHPFFELDEPTILTVGRLSKEKDYSTLLTAFALANKEIPSRLIILGEGSERDNLEKMMCNLNIKDRVSIQGHKDNPYPYFVHSDVFVLSSTREGLPTVLIEALALGMKIVSTDCPSGPREILENGLYGTLVPIKDAVSLAHGIIDAIHSPKKDVPKDALDTYKIESVITQYIHTTV